MVLTLGAPERYPVPHSAAKLMHRAQSTSMLCGSSVLNRGRVNLD